ncbi:hypothetical protein SAMN04488238_1056 [Roseicitreum antarcticum]|uniref:Uncharacterized protein n=1 Tax=Roseicitreum antarcticum TaxID=564137 RepID=A0A1H2YHK8_9RHOB|nr:hypothetical protein SAMN04488238_1056 [Roseicitreum antarcticum]
MLRAVILMCVVFPALTACDGWRSVGKGVEVSDLPPAARLECKSPAAFLRAGDFEIIAGRMGDELIRCEQRRGLAVQGFDGVRDAVATK